MEIQSDDDSSAASSGDEMLEMKVPFSQKSDSTSPDKSSKGSDSEHEEVKQQMDIAEGGTRKPKRSPKRKHDETVVVDDTMDEAEMEKKGVFFICNAIS